jgi:hypothetical protein
MERHVGWERPLREACTCRPVSRKPCRTLLLALLVLHSGATAGCSFIQTKGPQPNVQPPPPCTTDNTWPNVDTGIAVVSVAALVGGAILVAQRPPASCSGQIFCGLEQGLTGVGLALGGLVGSAVFIPSAVTGYGRTADCRAWLAANPQFAPQPPPEPGPSSPSSFLVPAARCPSRGDAPLLCLSDASRGPDATHPR